MENFRSSSRSLPNHRFRNILFAIITHSIWSCNTVLIRYLEKRGGVNWAILLCSTRGGAMVVILLFQGFLEMFRDGSGHKERKKIPIPLMTDSKNSLVSLSPAHDDGVKSFGDQNSNFEHLLQQKEKEHVSVTNDDVLYGQNNRNDNYLETKNKNELMKKRLFSAAIFSLAATIRASLNIASAMYTLSFNIALINCLAPIAISWADSAFLGTKLPKIIWPAIALTVVGCALVAISQSPLMSQNALDEYSFSQQDTIGVSLASLSMTMSVFCRLLMKTTAGVLTPIEITQSANVGLIVSLFLYSMCVTPSGWLVFLHFSRSELAAWLFLTIAVFSMASVSQVTLVRSLGAGLYSSFAGIRVIGSVFLSTVLLNEPVTNWIEWTGIFLTVGTVTWYVSSLMFIGDGQDDSRRIILSKSLPVSNFALEVEERETHFSSQLSKEGTSKYGSVKRGD